MSFIAIIYTLVVAVDLWWWWYTDRRALSAGLSKRWRVGIAVLMGATLLGVFLLIIARVLHFQFNVLFESAVMWLYLWHIIVMPVALVFSLGDSAIDAVRRLIRPKPASESSLQSRRQFLTRAIIVTPPAVVAALTGHATLSEDDLQVRYVDVPLPNLPSELDGLTIAHMTDPHLGMFISDRKVKAIIDMTNNLDADLVLQTGDLINSSLADLPDGIAMVRALKGRYGTYCCQGNHDVMMSRFDFEKDTKLADINMLTDEDRVISVRGHRLRLIGSRWTGYDDDYMTWRMQQLVPSKPTDFFTIMLAHHPHSFDSASAQGIPFTLSGHTHGGQLALTHNIGIGPLMYRYWSGLYQKENSACFVSNGTGNWFPLRINVPCEVVKLTLRRSTASGVRTVFTV